MNMHATGRIKSQQNAVPLCSIRGCDGASLKRQMCSAHYQKWWKYGDPLVSLTSTAPGEPRQWIMDIAVPFAADECLFWPYGKDSYGYGAVRKQDGPGMEKVHRVVCAIVHGEPPSGDMDCAHSCGNGHLGCVSPAHLRWATRKQNFADMVRHGTRLRGERKALCKLTEDQVREIRAMRGEASQRQIALEYGVSHEVIGKIYRGKNWTHVQ